MGNHFHEECDTVDRLAQRLMSHEKNVEVKRGRQPDHILVIVDYHIGTHIDKTSENARYLMKEREIQRILREEGISSDKYTIKKREVQPNTSPEDSY